MARITLLVGAGLFFLFGGIYTFLIRQDIQFKEFSRGPLATIVPSGWSVKQSRHKGWETVGFQDGVSWLMLAYYAEKEADPDYLDRIHKGMKGYALHRPLRIYTDGYYYLFARGKNRRRFLAIFTHRGVPWWIESGTHRSTHRIYKEVLDRALLRLRIDGEAVRADLASEIEAIDRETGIRYVQGDTVWLLFIMTPGLLAMGLMGAISWLGGRPARPDQFSEETITRQALSTDMSIKGRGGYNLRACSLYLTDARLAAFGLFRPVMELRHDKDGEVEISSGRSRFFGMPYLQVVRKGRRRVRYRFFLNDAQMWVMEVNDRRRVAGR